jgi:histone-lysine N-methyltransferase SETMAR
MELSKRDLRVIMYYEFEKGSSASDCSKSMCEVLGDHVVSERTVYRWFSKWQGGALTLEDNERPGRPTEIDLDELKKMVDDNPTYTCGDLSLEFGLSDETIRLNLHKLGYSSRLNKWIPHNLSEKNKSSRLSKCSNALRLYKEIDLDRIITVDEKWVRYKNYRRERSWVPKGGSPAQTPKRELTKDKILLVCFWSVDGVIYTEYLNYGQTLTSTKYNLMLTKVDGIIKRTWTGARRRRGILFLQDNARPHTSNLIKNKLKKLDWQVIDHPAYSPDCSPSDYHLFLALQNHLNGKLFDDSESLIEEVENFFSSRPAEFYQQGIRKLPQIWQEIVNKKGEY